MKWASRKLCGKTGFGPDGCFLFFREIKPVLPHNSAFESIQVFNRELFALWFLKEAVCFNGTDSQEIVHGHNTNGMQLFFKPAGYTQLIIERATMQKFGLHLTQFYTARFFSMVVLVPCFAAGFPCFILQGKSLKGPESQGLRTKVIRQIGSEFDFFPVFSLRNTENTLRLVRG